MNPTCITHLPHPPSICKGSMIKSDFKELLSSMEREVWSEARYLRIGIIGKHNKIYFGRFWLKSFECRTQKERTTFIEWKKYRSK